MIEGSGSGSATLDGADAGHPGGNAFKERGRGGRRVGANRRAKHVYSRSQRYNYCLKCGDEGHYVRHCLYAGSFLCFVCWMEGHKAFHCPQRVERRQWCQQGQVEVRTWYLLKPHNFFIDDLLGRLYNPTNLLVYSALSMQISRSLLNS